MHIIPSNGSNFSRLPFSMIRWAIWSQRLYHTWESFAKEAQLHSKTLGVGKINCVTYAEFCKDHQVMAFPTLRWYEDGKAIAPDYRMERTVMALVEYAKQKLSERMSDDAWLEAIEAPLASE